MIYRVWIRPQALKEIAALPGNVRNRVKPAIDTLAREPRPSESAALVLPAAPGVTPELHEARRFRLDHWRVICLVNDIEAWVTVVAVRRRLQYGYIDLAALTSG